MNSPSKWSHKLKNDLFPCAVRLRRIEVRRRCYVVRIGSITSVKKIVFLLIIFYKNCVEGCAINIHLPGFPVCSEVKSAINYLENESLI